MITVQMQITFTTLKGKGDPSVEEINKVVEHALNQYTAHKSAGSFLYTKGQVHGHLTKVIT